jgi:hypothetical protein
MQDAGSGWAAINDGRTTTGKSDREAVTGYGKLNLRFNSSGKLITKIQKPATVKRPGRRLTGRLFFQLKPVVEPVQEVTVVSRAADTAITV